MCHSKSGLSIFSFFFYLYDLLSKKKYWRRLKRGLERKNRALRLDGKDVDESDFSPPGFGSRKTMKNDGTRKKKAAEKKQNRASIQMFEMQERSEGDIVREQENQTVQGRRKIRPSQTDGTRTQSFKSLSQ